MKIIQYIKDNFVNIILIIAITVAILLECFFPSNV